MKVIGLDIGYGYTKVFSPPENHIFPTKVSTSIPESVFDRKYPIVKVNGEKYLVGERFISGFGEIDPMTENFIGSDHYLAILGEALIRSHVNPDVLVIGMPPGLYTREKANELCLEIYNATISDANTNNIVSPRKVKVIPQGAGIFFDYAFQGNDGVFNMNVAVIDIGHYTVDIVFFAHGEYLQGKAISFNTGVATLFETVSKEFTRRYGLYFKDDEVIAKIIRSGGIVHGGNEYSLDCTDFVNSYKRQLLSSIDKHLDSAPFHIDLILAAGGGVKAIKDYKSKYQILNPEYPQMSNAIGYYRYGKKLAQELF